MRKCILFGALPFLKHTFLIIKACKRNFHRLTFLSEKGKPKNFAPNTPICLGKAFEIPKDFSRKVLCVRVWGGQPQLIILIQKTRLTPCFLLLKFLISHRCGNYHIIIAIFDNPHSGKFLHDINKMCIFCNI